MDFEAVAKIHADTLNKGIVDGLKDIGFKLSIGLVIIAVAIYKK